MCNGAYIILWGGEGENILGVELKVQYDEMDRRWGVSLNIIEVNDLHCITIPFYIFTSMLNMKIVKL